MVFSVAKGFAFVVFNDGILAFRVFVTLHDVAPGYDLIFLLTHALEPHGRIIGAMQQPEADLLARAYGGMQLDRNVHKSETQSALPNWSHARIVAIWESYERR